MPLNTETITAVALGISLSASAETVIQYWPPAKTLQLSAVPY